MPFAEHFMLQGSFTLPATLPAVVNVNCGFLPTKIQLINQTLYGNVGTGFLNWQDANWDYNFPTNTQGTYINAAGTALLPYQINATPSTLPPPPGITLYDGTQSVLLGAAITGTTVDKTTGIFTVTSTAGLQVGDTVLITNDVVMKQIGSMTFNIASLTSTTFTISNPGFLNTANFTNESGFIARKVIVGPLYYPSRSRITAISQAAGMVVTTATQHGLTVGQKVRILVPAVFGMTQANNLTGLITAVGSTTTFTIGSINSSAFTAFAWPAVTSLPFSYAQVIPEGSGPSPVVTPPFYNVDVLDDATTNIQFQGFTVGTGLLATATNAVIGVAASNVISWTAWRADV